MAMFSSKSRENRRGRLPKISKNLERLYKEGKCSECSVIVTPMDFAKILGKFNKVKIKYESGTVKKDSKPNSSVNTRLKNNENGMVLIHRNAYNQHPADLLKSSKSSEKSSPRINNVKDKKGLENSSPQHNILKENNRLKKSPIGKKTSITPGKPILKQYGIVFLNPVSKKTENRNGNLSLKNLLPSIDNNILPSNDWCVDYLPKDGEPKEDKVYDRIAAELEDLMNNDKPGEKIETKLETGDNKDDFPSIMDILNDNTISSHQATTQTATIVQANLESSDVEAMLLGKTSATSQEPGSAPMEVDQLVINNLMDVVPMNTDQDAGKVQKNSETIENPNSPSILDETLQKGIEAHLPIDILPHEPPVVENSQMGSKAPEEVKSNGIRNTTITHVVFKKCINGLCTKSVTCPKNLKYSIELEGKPVEFLGAPKFISCLEDLQVLLQIVNETEINCLYVCHGQI